jgi:hypothetical protein
MQTKIRARWPDTISSRLRDQDWHGLSPSMATAPLHQAHTTAPLKNAASCSQNKATPEEMVACWWFTAFVFFFVSATARRLLLRGARQCFSPTFDGNAAEAAGSGWEVCEREYRANGAQPFFSLRGNGVPKKPSLLGSGRRCTHGRCRAEKCDVGVPPHLCMGQLTQVKGVGGVLPSSIFFLLK